MQFDPTVVEKKAQLRVEMRTRLRAMVSGEQQRRSQNLIHQIVNLPCWQTAQTVLLFHPLSDEPDLRGLWALAEGKRLCLPRMESSMLGVYDVADVETLLSGRPSNPDPNVHPRVNPEELDFLLVPGMAFTAEGHRLGRGGGYYDRFLAHPQFHAQRCGIGFECQLLSSLPVEPHDAVLDRVLTG